MSWTTMMVICICRALEVFVVLKPWEAAACTAPLSKTTASATTPFDMDLDEQVQA